MAQAWGSTVTFRVTAEVPQGERVFITGNHPALGEWNPGAVPLREGPQGRWEATFDFPPGTVLEYKLTLGSWDREALAPDSTVPPNSVLVVASDTVVVTHVPAWKSVRPRVGGITGEVITHQAMGGSGILPRDVHVWLPPGYHDSGQRYPVLYVHDGQQVFDPSTSTWGRDWGIDETATQLIQEGRIPGIMVVAVNNTARRYEEYSDCEEGLAYRLFLTETLKPFIDRTYRTLPDRAHTAVMGSSMGGLVSFLLAWYHPQVFGAAACLSPAFSYGDLRRAALGPPPAPPVRLYLDNGGVGLERWLQPGCDRMLRILLDKGLSLGADVVWYQDSTAEHSEAAWAARVWRPLTFLFGDPSWASTGQTLPPPSSPLDESALSWGQCEAVRVVGVGAETRLTQWDRQLPLLWEAASLVQPPGWPQSPVVALLAPPGASSRVRVVVGTEVALGDSVASGLAQAVVPAGSCATLVHLGPATDLGQVLHHLFTWVLPGLRADLAGPVLMRCEPEGVTLTIPLTPF